MPQGILLAIGTGAVAAVLLLGLVNMLRGGRPPQKPMRWRAGLQFAVILNRGVSRFRG